MSCRVLFEQSRWWPRSESNRDGQARSILSRLRLPVPPRGRARCEYDTRITRLQATPARHEFLLELRPAREIPRPRGRPAAARGLRGLRHRALRESARRRGLRAGVARPRAAVAP